MNDEQKCVVVIDEALPLGIIVNTATIMGITLGKHVPEIVGPTVYDKSDKEHIGIITFPVPILKTNKEQLELIRNKLYDTKFSSLVVVDFSDVAQSCISYDDYIQKMASVEETDLNYFGIGLCGDKKLINKLTGSLPLLR